MNFTVDADKKTGELEMTGVNPHEMTKVRKVTVKLAQGTSQHHKVTYLPSDGSFEFPVKFDLSGLDFAYTRVKVYFLGFKKRNKKKIGKLFCVHRHTSI
jgi:hypothetical protein